MARLSERGGSRGWLGWLVGLALLVPGVATGTSMLTYQRGDWDTSAWWFRLRSNGYAFQTAAPGASAQDHFGFYQVYDGAATGLADGRLTLRMAGRFADDLAAGDPFTDRNRLYNGYAQWSTVTWRSRSRLGRQFLQEGSTHLTLDGLFVSARPHPRWELRGWAGARAPVGRTYELNSLSDDTAVGARVVGTPLQTLRLGFSWGFQKVNGAADVQPVGLETAYTPKPGWRFVGRAAYEIERETWDRIEVVGRVQTRRDVPVVSLQYLDRRAAINASSYFARFSDLERIRIARITLRQEFRPGYGGELEYFGSFVAGRTSTRLAAVLLLKHARVGYSARLGEAGEESRLFGDLTVRPVEWLDLAAGATLSSYALLEDAPVAEERELVTAFARVAARIRPGMELVAEVRSLENPFYQEDVRFLLGLDLLMGRGPSRFGLGRGGWLQ